MAKKWQRLQGLALSTILASTAVVSGCDREIKTDTGGTTYVDQQNQYSVIVYGNEIPSIVAAISASRKEGSKVLLLRPEGEDVKLGGHVTNGLAYLDRDQRDPFADSQSKIYTQIIRSSGSSGVALNPDRANDTIKSMLHENGVNIISDAQINRVHMEKSGKIKSIETSKGVFGARNFIDGTQSAELARMSGVPYNRGFSDIGLPNSTLSIGVPFELTGVSVPKLKEMERNLYNRFNDKSDQEAQQWLRVASGNDQGIAKQLLDDMQDKKTGNLKDMYVSREAIDVRSPVFSVAFHGMSGISIKDWRTGDGKILFDKANIAVIDSERLSFNALLWRVDAKEAVQIADNDARPTEEMKKTGQNISNFFHQLYPKSEVKIADEVYVRHTVNIADAKTPISGTTMMNGGCPEREAVGSFKYHLDIRGGIPGLDAQMAMHGESPPAHFEIPTYGIGVEHTLPKSVPNLAVVGPASGYTGLAVGAGRIVENNSIVAEALGITISEASSQNKDAFTITNRQARYEVERAFGSRKSFQPVIANTGDPVVKVEATLLNRPPTPRF